MFIFLLLCFKCFVQSFACLSHKYSICKALFLLTQNGHAPSTNGHSNGVGVASVTDSKSGSVILFASSVDKRTEMSMLMQQIKKQWSDQDYKCCRDLQKYVLDKEDAWVLDRDLLAFVGDVLCSISAETKVRLMRVLAVCALKESFVHFLHQDREKRHLMNYANKFDQLTLDEQKAVGLFICHLFANQQTQNWALYFSEWTAGYGDDDDSSEDEGDENGDPPSETTSNARITAKITRMCLQDLNPTLQGYGGAIAHNLALRRVRVMHRPASMEDEDISGSQLESESVSHSSLASNGGKMATLRAHDALALELTVCIVDQLFRKKGTYRLTEPVLFQCLTALVSFLPLIKSDLSYYHETFDQDLKSLEGRKLSPRNQQLADTLLAQL